MNTKISYLRTARRKDKKKEHHIISYLKANGTVSHYVTALMAS